MVRLSPWFVTMRLSACAIFLRKRKSLILQRLADALDIHVEQIKRYQAGHAQAAGKALKKLALANPC
jgi:hypothetical protein